VTRFSKKVVVSISLITNTIFIFALYWVPLNNIWGVFFVEWLGQLSYSPTVPLLWVLFADVCDFTEWRNGRSIAGFIYSTFFFALKAGISLGAFLGLQVMQHYGYVANAAQDPRSKQGILLTLTLIPGIFSVGCALSMLLYPITKRMNQDLADELAQRRAAASGDV
jgi:Na+/melibiose symporter-like transporter